MKLLRTYISEKTLALAKSCNFDLNLTVGWPTQSDMQAWIRTYRDLDIEIRRNTNRGYMGFVENTGTGKMVFLHTDRYYDTYEDCLERCLMISLKYIKSQYKK